MFFLYNYCFFDIMWYNKNMRKSFLNSKFKSCNNSNFCFELLYDRHKDYYTLNCLNADGEKMGYLTFKMNAGQKAWIYYVYTNEKFYHQGVGRALLQTFEKIAFENGIRFVEGKFYPENQYARPLYNKTGYKIERDGYETLIYKTLEDEKFIESLEYERV